MADRFVVSGIPGFDGEYPIDIGAFTMREFQIIKRMSGVRAGELEEAFGAGDTDLILAIATIAVRRSGRAWEAFERLAWEADFAAITFESEQEEVAEEAAPLILTPLEQPDKPDEQPHSSGLDSDPDGSEIQETNLRAIGSQV